MPHSKILAEVTNKNIARFMGLLEVAEDDTNRSLLQRMLIGEVERLQEKQERKASLETHLGEIALKLDRHLKLIAYIPVGAAGRVEAERLICNLTMAYGVLAFTNRGNVLH